MAIGGCATGKKNVGWHAHAAETPGRTLALSLSFELGWAHAERTLAIETASAEHREPVGIILNHMLTKKIACSMLYVV